MFQWLAIGFFSKNTKNVIICDYNTNVALQVKVKSGRQPNIDVLINGDSDAFETKQQSSEIQGIKENALFIGGLPKLQNR